MRAAPYSCALPHRFASRARTGRPSLRIWPWRATCTRYRITDPEKSRAFYEALGFEFRRELPIVRNGEFEATNFFFGMPNQDEELELTYNHDGRSYELGSAYGHIAISADDLDETLERLAQQAIYPEREPYRVREGGSRLCFVPDPDS